MWENRCWYSILPQYLTGVTMCLYIGITMCLYICDKGWLSFHQYHEGCSWVLSNPVTLNEWLACLLHDVAVITVHSSELQRAQCYCSQQYHHWAERCAEEPVLPMETSFSSSILKKVRMFTIANWQVRLSSLYVCALLVVAVCLMCTDVLLICIVRRLLVTYQRKMNMLVKSNIPLTL